MVGIQGILLLALYLSQYDQVIQMSHGFSDCKPFLGCWKVCPVFGTDFPCHSGNNIPCSHGAVSIEDSENFITAGSVVLDQLITAYRVLFEL